jgi:hypothetical protein
MVTAPALFGAPSMCGPNLLDDSGGGGGGPVTELVLPAQPAEENKAARHKKEAIPVVRQPIALFTRVERAVGCIFADILIEF